MALTTTLRLVCLLLVAVVVPARAADLLQAISAAGEQRMLSQRIVKSFCQMGMNIQPLAAKAQLDEALHRFDANIERLREPALGSAEASEALLALEDLGRGLRALATGVPSLPAAERLTRQGDSVLIAAERLTRALTSDLAGGQGRLVNLAGRQRMLSQRMAKGYLLTSWGTRSPAIREELESAALEFAGALALLRERPENTPELQRELEDLDLQWEWLRAALASEGAVTYRLIVVESADAILGGAERVTRLYQQLTAR